MHMSHINITPRKTGDGYYNKDAGTYVDNSYDDSLVTYETSENGLTATILTAWKGLFLTSTPLQAGTQYHFKWDATSTGGVRASVYTLDSSFVIVRRIGNYTSNPTSSDANITLRDGEMYIGLWVGSNNANDVVTISQPQIELGSTATSYEVFAERDFEINLVGKNLIKFAQDNGSTERAGVTVTVNSNNTLTINGTATTNAWFELVDPSRFLQGVAVSSTIFDPLDSSQEYTLSARIISGSFTGSNPYISTQVGAGSNDNKSTTFDSSIPFTGSDGIYRMWLGINTNNVFDNCQIAIQLEAGSTATAYEPYFAPIELAGIGSYQDRINKTDGKWYIEKQVGKVVLNGSEDGWTFQSSNAPFRYRLTGSYGAYDDASTFMSDYFQSVAWNVSWVRYDYLMSPNPVNNLLAFRYTGISTLEDFKTWLSTHNTTVYYVLATATTTEITNQTLIDQLEALAGADLNQGVNNIFTEIATGNAMPTLELNWVEWEKYNRHNVYIWNDDIDDWQIIVGAGA